MAFSFEDVAKLRVQVLGDEAEKSMESLQKAAKDVKAQIDLLEVSGKMTTKEYVELKVLQRDITAEMREQRKQVDLNNASYNEMVGLKRSLTAELKKAKVGSDEWFEALDKLEPVNAKLAETDKAIRGVGEEANKSKGIWGNVKQWIMGAFAVTAILAFGRKVVDLGKQIFELTAKFEKYDTVLSNTLGGTEEAAAAMEMIKDIAATTPVVNCFRSLIIRYL